MPSAAVLPATHADIAWLKGLPWVNPAEVDEAIRKGEIELIDEKQECGQHAAINRISKK